MASFALIDWLALAFFVLSWTGYSWLVDYSRWRERTLTAVMNAQRVRWIETALRREMRMVDAQVVAGLQNGAAFFASTSLLAIGAGFALLTTSDEVLGIVTDLALGRNTTRAEWEMKALGLIGIYAYAFFKFGWSYRLFNYLSILIGALPPAEQRGATETQKAVAKAAQMSISAGRHFSRGQRAFFFSVGFLGWFGSAWLLLAITLAVLVALFRRQFAFQGLDEFR